MQPVLLLILGGVLLVLAGSGRLAGSGFAGGVAGWLRFVPLVLGVWARQQFSVDLLATLGLLGGLAASRGHDDRDDRLAIGQALLVVGLANVILSTSIGFQIEEGIAAMVSGVAGLFVGPGIDLGPVFGGARPMLLAALLLASFGQAGWRRWTLVLSGVFALTVVASILVEAMAAQFTFGSKGGGSGIYPVLAAQLSWLPMLVFVLSVPLVMRLVRESQRVPHRLIGTLAVAAGLCVFASLPPAPLRAVEHVVFYRPGFSNWETADPELSTAGPYSTGMMGTLPSFARSLGATAELVDEIRDEDLEDCDVLVLINQDEPLLEGTPERIQKWVEAGGHVVVVGDHTFIRENDETGEWEAFINQPLAGTGIRFPNNSGDHLTVAFKDATVTTGMLRRLDCVEGNPYSPIIGAGLDVQWPARPIVIGRFGFSDEGIIPSGEEDQAIGDLIWNRGERLGGLVLLAEQQVGDGRVTAVGDTTGFHNIGRTNAWQAVGQLMLGHGRDGSSWLWMLSAGALVALGVLSFRGKAPDPLASVGVLAGLATFGNLAPDSLPIQNPREPLMVMDLAVAPHGRTGDWSKEGYLTQISNAARSDMLPINMDTAQHGIPAGTKTILLSRPRVDPGEAWRAELMQFVHDGGHLIIASAYEPDNVLDDLFTEIGCRIEPRVIGPQSASIEAGGRTYRIRLQETWNLRLERGEWRRIVYGEDSLSLATRAFGSGRVTVTTDQTFLQNWHLENEEKIYQDNLRYMMSLLREGWSR